MARIGEWIDTRRNLGPAAAPEVLNAWVGQRAAMNAAGKVDPVKLAEAEAKVRGDIARLRRAQMEYSTSQGKQASDLSKEMLRAAARVKAASIAAGAQRTSALIGYRGKLADEQARTQLTIEDKQQVRDPAMKAALGAASRTAGAAGTDPTARVDAVVRLIDDQKAAAGNPKPGTLQHDGLVTIAIESMEQNGDSAGAQALAEKYGAKSGESWDDYMRSAHAGITDDQVEREIKQAEKYGAGGGFEGIEALFGRLNKDGGTTSSGEKVGGAIPQPDFEAQIKGLEDMADELAKERAKALIGGGGVNEIIFNPNQVSDMDAVRRAQVWGVNAPGYNQEVADAVDRNDGSLTRAAKEIAGKGGLSAVSAIEVPPVMLGGDAIAPPMTWTGTKKGEGGWTYTFNADGSIATVKPDGKAGKTVKPGSKEHAAIVDEVAKVSAPGLVRDLYGAAEARALVGDFAGAEKAAKAVDRGAVRSAWAEELRKATREGKGAEFVALLTPETGGKWVTHAQKIAIQPVASQYDEGRQTGEFLRLADAMDSAEDAQTKFEEPDYTSGQIEASKNPATAYMFDEPVLDQRAALPVPTGQFKGSGVVEPAPIYSRVGEEPLRLGYSATATDVPVPDVDDSDIDEWYKQRTKGGK